MATIECSLLGYPTFNREGEAISGFISSKALLLGCYLVMHPHKAHGREVLAAYFWGDSPDSRAKPNLRQALHNLQKLFPDGFEVTRQTVAVMPDYFATDIAQLAAIAGAAAPAEDELLAAVDLYAGEFLEGLPADDMPDIEDWLRGQREHYRGQYLSILEKLARHYTAQRKWKALEAVCRRALRVEAWHEAMQLHLVNSLARQGKLAQALKQVQAYTELLEDELGLMPGPAVEQLARRIRFAQRAPRHNLKTAPTAFVPRSDELSRILALLRQPEVQLLTVVGLGGSGKSRLARQAGHLLLDEFANGVADFPLSGTDHAISTMVEVLVQAGFIDPMPQNEPPVEYLKFQLAGLEMLLLVDSFEHLLEQATELERLLEGNPDLKLLVTSREPLNLRRERLVKLNGMAYPAATGQPVEGQAFGALALFEQTARRIRPAFQLSDEHLPAVVDICRLVEGMPLAVELAAAWVDVQSPPAIAAEIRHNLDALHDLHQDRPARHQSIRASFDYSWQLLGEAERALLSRLAIFAGEFSYEAARACADANRLTLKKLADKSLVWPAGASHFRLHDLMRVYAREALEANLADYATTAARHCAYFLQRLVQTAERIRGREGPAVRQQIARDIEDIRQAWRAALQQGHYEDLTRATWPVYIYFLDSYLIEDGIRFFEASLAALSDADHPHLVADWLIYTSQLEMIHRGYTRARERIEQAAALSERENYAWGRAWAHYLKGRANWQLTANLGADRAHLTQSLALAESMGEPRLAGHCHYVLGQIKAQTDQDAEAAIHLDTARQLFEELGDLKASTAALISYAYTNLMLQPAGEVLPIFYQCLEVSRAIGKPVYDILYYIAETCFSARDEDPRYLGQARDALHEALDRLREMKGHEVWVMHCLRQLARVEAVEGHVERMRAYLRRTMALAAQLRVTRYSTLNLAAAGLCLLQVEQTDLGLAALALALHHPSRHPGSIRFAQEALDMLPPAAQATGERVAESVAFALEIAQRHQAALAQEINLDPAYLAELLAEMAAAGPAD